MPGILYRVETLVRFGVHVSITGSIDMAVDRAKERGCDTFQIFTRNPRGWKYKKLDAKEAEEFKRKLGEGRIGPAVAHMPYLPNISSPKKAIYTKSLKALSAELERCALLKIPYLVTHLGSHLGKGREVGLERLINAVNTALSESKSDVMLLLENTAGTKNSMGTSFEEIKEILDHVEQRERAGICLDTCHAFAAGYDLRNAETVDKTLRELDEVIGLKLLKVVHVNDSKGQLGSHRDRHEHIGMGYIGDEGFRAVLHHEALKDFPLILETPVDRRRDDFANLRKLRSLAD